MKHELNLGKVITTEQQRDAIHVAVAPVVCAEPLLPGAHVGLNGAGRATKYSTKLIGVIDPFLKRVVEAGETCWLFMYPNTITSLRHEWSHPAFPVETKTQAGVQTSKDWLRVYAKSHLDEEYLSGRDAYDVLMEQVADGNITYLGQDMHGIYDLKDGEELFRHLSVVLGRKITAESFEYFGCSC